MAFFGLTQMGYQNQIRECVKTPRVPQPGFGAESIQLPPFKEVKRASIVPINQTSGYGPGNKDSRVEWHRLRFKHTRNPEGPLELYRYPTITSHDYAYWSRHAPITKNEPWTYVKRHTHVNSEMTKFVKDMCLTNREFSLF